MSVLTTKLRRRHNRASYRGQFGLSLIELMIALLISLVLVAAIAYIFIGNRQAFRTQTSDSRMTDNARIAIENLSRDFRHAAKLGATRPDSGSPDGAVMLTALMPVMETNFATLAPMMQPIIDGLTRVEDGVTTSKMIEPGWFIRAFDDATGYIGPVMSTRVIGTDVIQLIKGGESGAHLAIPMSGPEKDPVLSHQIPGAAPGSSKQLFVITDGKQAEIIRASINTAVGYPGGRVNMDRADWNTGGTLSKAYRTDAYVTQFSPVIYMIQAPSTASNSRLNRLVKFTTTSNGGDAGRWGTQPDVVADGVNDLQVRFGLALAGKAADTYLTPTQINALGSSNAWQQVRSVELTITMQSEPDNPGSRLSQRIVHVISLRNTAL